MAVCEVCHKMRFGVNLRWCCVKCEERARGIACADDRPHVIEVARRPVVELMPLAGLVALVTIIETILLLVVR